MAVCTPEGIRTECRCGWQSPLYAGTTLPQRRAAWSAVLAEALQHLRELEAPPPS